MIKLRLKELENTDKYQVVTAQDSRFFAYQIIAKHLYEIIFQEEFENFEFLRYPHKGLLKSPEDFFKEYPDLKNSKVKNPKVLDLLPEISRQLLSCSLSMETNTPADSALFVFIFGKGISEWSNSKQEDVYNAKFVQHIAELFESVGITQSAYEPYINELVDSAPKTNEGIINQIFFPKENIGNYLYFSISGGFLHPEQNTEIHATIAKFQESCLNSDFDAKKNIQTRVLVGSLFDRNVTIYRYTLIPEQEQENYKKLVKEIIKNIFNENNR